MKRFFRQGLVLCLLSLCFMPARAQHADVNARIREEGMERSQIMQTLHYLTDVYGPRLTGSPSLEEAGAWALEQLTTWGLGSDHTSFSSVGLPGISMGQDPIRYFSHTWHTNLDTYERILEDDMKQAAVVVAATVYHLAMQDDLLPRFSAEEMPANPISSR